MKNLNIKRAAMPNLFTGKSVNRTFLYSVCAALFLLGGLLSMKAQSGKAHTGDNSGYDAANAYDLAPLGIGATENYQESHYNSSSSLTNNYGENGNDKWMKITITTYGYLRIAGGSTLG